MRVAEATAKTRVDAIERAIQKLGVERHEVEVEILDEGSSGFLGIGQRDVHVRVTAEHLSDDGSAEIEDDNFGNLIDAPAPQRKQTQTQRHVNRRGRAGGNRTGRDGSDRVPRADREPHKVRSAKAPEPSRERQRRPRAESRQTAPRPPRRERKTPVDRESAEAIGKSAAALLGEIIEKMGMDVSVESSLNQEDNILLDVSSEDSAILIGRKGRNLEALQFLMNRMVLQGDDAEAVDRLVVDIEGYVRRRRENLEDMAQNMASKAKETGHSVRLKPLDPQERRIVHLALEDDPEVRTFSLGNSMLRRVVIVPEGAEDEDDYTDNSRRRGRRSNQESEEETTGPVAAESTQGEPDES